MSDLPDVALFASLCGKAEIVISGSTVSCMVLTDHLKKHVVYRKNGRLGHVWHETSQCLTSCLADRCHNLIEDKVPESIKSENAE